jgi:hypothetical protein
LFQSLLRPGLRAALRQQHTESWGVIAHPPSFKGLIRMFRRVREIGERIEESSVFQERETSQFELKPKLGYKLPAKAYLYSLR